jgi:hypothetical protein
MPLNFSDKASKLAGLPLPGFGNPHRRNGTFSRIGI